MHQKRSVKYIYIVLICLIASFGCTPIIKIRLDYLHEKDFEGLQIPEIEKIKSGGKSKRFSYATFDEIWDAIILVLIQKGIIAHASKDMGIIVAVTSPSLGIFVERGDVVTVYLNWMTDFYQRLDTSVMVVYYTSDNMEIIAKNFFDIFANQIYAGQKWKYLYK